MQQKTAPADRAKALLSKFGTLDHPNDVDSDGTYSDCVSVGDLTIWVDSFYNPQNALNVAVYGFDGGSMEKTVLRLSAVADDDLVESIIQQVIDHHNGKQVV